MGYRVLGARKDDMFAYTTKGTNRAYVQYRQPVPKGFERLRFWPVEVFNELMPPAVSVAGVAAASVAARPRLIKSTDDVRPAGPWRTTPVVFNSRPAAGAQLPGTIPRARPTPDISAAMYLYIAGTG